MGTTAAQTVGDHVRWYDEQTQETILALAPIWWKDDFVGEALKTDVWGTVEVNLNTAIAVRADINNGIVRLELDSDSNAEDAVLYFTDQRPFDVSYNGVVEFRLSAAVIPTTGVKVVWGMASDHNLDKDTVAEHAWFQLDAAATLNVELDDATTIVNQRS